MRVCCSCCEVMQGAVCVVFGLAVDSTGGPVRDMGFCSGSGAFVTADADSVRATVHSLTAASTVRASRASRPVEDVASPLRAGCSVQAVQAGWQRSCCGRAAERRPVG